MTTLSFLQLEPTTRCNFTCAFCVGREMRQADLPVDVALNALSKFPDVERVELQGEGEPLLNKSFFHIAERFAARGAVLSMITNGSLLSHSNVDRLLALPFERISVSIESSVATEFARIRGGSLDKVKRGLELLVSERNRRAHRLPVIGLNVTVLKSTLPGLEAIVDLYKELRLDGGIGFQGLQDMAEYTATYNNEMRKEVLSANEERLVEQFRDAFSARRDVNKSGQHTGFFAQLFRDFWSEPKTCPWLEKALYISAEGEAMPCCHVKDTQCGFGNIALTSPLEILQRRDAMRESLDGGNVPVSCRDCWVVKSIAAMGETQVAA